MVLGRPESIIAKLVHHPGDIAGSPEHLTELVVRITAVVRRGAVAADVVEFLFQGKPVYRRMGEAKKKAEAESVKSIDVDFSESYSRPVCGFSMPDLEPRMFSFNSPYGACPECTGLGTKTEFDPEFAT